MKILTLFKYKEKILIRGLMAQIKNSHQTPHQYMGHLRDNYAQMGESNSSVNQRENRPLVY